MYEILESLETHRRKMDEERENIIVTNRGVSSLFYNINLPCGDYQLPPKNLDASLKKEPC